MFVDHIVFMTFGHSKLVSQQKCNYQLGLLSSPSPNRPFLLNLRQGAVPPTLGSTSLHNNTRFVTECLFSAF